ncbi:helix-turn-helix transcriptional regulator [Gleimia sp. 6138-11-ORH1]|uniref:heat shock protein transcriptional repressor HspR n=1 Tax=Gleimia sp. 6138-11-ORH1 TaxID=2973937 RepID=UPI002167FAE7|nr:helix-turn-helix transcriptional regulator [Gleimia sp. 6138-11-ORH1]MCS4484824.1 helix-turn-helix transcriptional regulator [Gleimia sp. 6138-11-ORH1]
MTTFVISVAAELAGMHPQTLRQYDRLGIVIPARTKGKGRRYSTRDVERLREVQRLSQDEGINLEGIRRILQLQAKLEAATDELAQLKAENALLQAKLELLEERRTRVFAASSTGDVVTVKRGSRVRAEAPGTELIPANHLQALKVLRHLGII